MPGVNASGSGGGATGSAVSRCTRSRALRMRAIAPCARPRARKPPWPKLAIGVLRGMTPRRAAWSAASRSLQASSARHLVLLDPAPPLGRLRGAVAVVPVAVARDLSLLGLQDRGGQALQEHAVVGDREHRATVRPQLRLQPLDRPVVEVVGRLVQEQQLRPWPGRPPGRAWSAHRRRGCPVDVRGAAPAGRGGAARCPPGGRRRTRRGPRSGRGAPRTRRARPVAAAASSPARRGAARPQGTQVREGQVDGVLDGGGRGGTVWGRYPTPPTAPTVTSPLSGRS